MADHTNDSPARPLDAVGEASGQHDLQWQARWHAVVDRDPRSDGRFVYAVRTTGIYCRPTCPSRRPRPENVTFHETPAHAESAGYRACQRCRPDRIEKERTGGSPQSALITDLCRFIETADPVPTLQVLAQRAGYSPYHLQRLFKQATGLTPKAYAKAHQGQRVRQKLKESITVTRAIHDAGYDTAGRFYADAGRMIGMTPSTYRNGGLDTTIRFAVGECSLGSVLVARSEHGICAITLGDDPEALACSLQDNFPQATLVGDDPEFERLVSIVIGFIDAPGTGLDLPLDIRGTAFQQRVWNALRTIPAGETWSYTKLATHLGAPSSVRAVASACAANTIAVAIPCHRIVRTDGSLSGYRWGVERKRALISREAQQRIESEAHASNATRHSSGDPS